MNELIPLLLVFGVLGAIATLFGSSGADKLRARWAEIARARRWDMTAFDALALHAEIDRVIVTIEPIRGDGRDDGLRLSAGGITPHELTFKIGRKSASFLHVLGEPHLRLGEPFDAAFSIESNDPALARAWFHRALLRSFHFVARHDLAFSMSLAKGNLVAEVALLHASGAELETLAALVAGAANGQRELAARWAQLARTLGGELHDAFAFPPAPIVIARPAALLRVEACKREGQWATRVSIDPVHAERPEDVAYFEQLEGIELDAEPLGKMIDALYADAQKRAGNPYR